MKKKAAKKEKKRAPTKRRSQNSSQNVSLENSVNALIQAINVLHQHLGVCSRAVLGIQSNMKSFSDSINLSLQMAQLVSDEIVMSRKEILRMWNESHKTPPASAYRKPGVLEAIARFGSKAWKSLPGRNS